MTASSGIVEKVGQCTWGVCATRQIIAAYHVHIITTRTRSLRLGRAALVECRMASKLLNSDSTIQNTHPQLGDSSNERRVRAKPAPRRAEVYHLKVVRLCERRSTRQVQLVRNLKQSRIKCAPCSRYVYCRRTLKEKRTRRQRTREHKRKFKRVNYCCRYYWLYK